VIIFMDMCVVKIVAIVMQLRNFGPYGTVYMKNCAYYFRFPRHS
jgi:hypothetical protein